MILNTNDYIYAEGECAVIAVDPMSIAPQYWEVIENCYSQWCYGACDQRYLDGGVHMSFNRKLISFYLKLRHSHFLVVVKNDEILAFSELYFEKTPIAYINNRKMELSYLGIICFSNITMVMPNALRTGVSLILEKAKERLCKKFGTQVIMSLICTKPIPNLASLNRARKLGAYFTGSTFITKRKIECKSDLIDVEYTEVLYLVDKDKKIILDCRNRFIIN